MSEHLPEPPALPERAILEIAQVQLAIEDFIRQMDEDVEITSEEDRMILIYLMCLCYTRGWEDRFYAEHPDAPRIPEDDS